jgi:hypothetical protein
MTREDAIYWLDRLYMGADMTDEYGDMVNMRPYEEALNMAIEALEQEPKTCKKCIYANVCIMYEPTMRRCKDYQE